MASSPDSSWWPKVSGVFDDILAIIRNMWAMVQGVWPVFIWAIPLIAAALGGALALFAAFVAVIPLIHPILNSAAVAAATASWAGYYAKVNAYVPLDEMIYISVVLMTLRLVSLQVRLLRAMIPSWVPGAGNG